mmetsp:Transcript_15389/g.23844  ORF Transcript_15389/g.23844 Transcript_15389/m.23844 type:complete len:102 (+) Transcript_15389:1005-1310(+)
MIIDRKTGRANNHASWLKGDLIKYITATNIQTGATTYVKENIEAIAMPLQYRKDEQSLEAAVSFLYFTSFEVRLPCVAFSVRHIADLEIVPKNPYQQSKKL